MADPVGAEVIQERWRNGWFVKVVVPRMMFQCEGMLVSTPRAVVQPLGVGFAPFDFSDLTHTRLTNGVTEMSK